MEEDKIEYQSAGPSGNYYGGLYIAKYKGKRYWIIENYDTNLDDISEWEEMSFELYDCFLNE